MNLKKLNLKGLLLGAYILGVIAFSIASRAEMTNFPRPIKMHPAAQLVQLSGVVQVDSSGYVYLIGANQAVTRLELMAQPSVEIMSLNSFHGQVVTILGATLTRNVQPVIAEIGSTENSGEIRRELAVPTVFVLRISGSSN